MEKTNFHQIYSITQNEVTTKKSCKMVYHGGYNIIIALMFSSLWLSKISNGRISRILTTLDQFRGLYSCLLVVSCNYEIDDNNMLMMVGTLLPPSIRWRIKCYFPIIPENQLRLLFRSVDYSTIGVRNKFLLHNYFYTSHVVTNRVTPTTLLIVSFQDKSRLINNHPQNMLISACSSFPSL